MPTRSGKRFKPADGVGNTATAECSRPVKREPSDLDIARILLPGSERRQKRSDIPRFPAAFTDLMQIDDPNEHDAPQPLKTRVHNDGTGTGTGSQHSLSLRQKKTPAKAKTVAKPAGVMFTVAEAIAALALAKEDANSIPTIPYDLRTGEFMAYPVKRSYHLGAMGRYGTDALKIDKAPRRTPGSPFILPPQKGPGRTPEAPQRY